MTKTDGHYLPQMATSDDTGRSVHAEALIAPCLTTIDTAAQVFVRLLQQFGPVPQLPPRVLRRFDL